MHAWRRRTDLELPDLDVRPCPQPCEYHGYGDGWEGLCGSANTVSYIGVTPRYVDCQGQGGNEGLGTRGEYARRRNA